MQTLTTPDTTQQKLDASFGVALAAFKARYSEPLTLPPSAVDGDDYTYASSAPLKPIREVTPPARMTTRRKTFTAILQN